jgi:nucleotide-binding universal stress UspA family protein
MADTELQPIVVGVDGSSTSDAALAWAYAEARLRGSTVVALYVLAVPWELTRTPVEEAENKLEREGLQVLGEALARTPADGVVVESKMLEGSPSELLVEASEQAELLVIGARRHGALASLVRRSVGDTVVHDAHCPVVVVRG